MTRIDVRVEGHYEVHATPFAKSYEWHPAYLTLVCDCGAESTSCGTGSTLPTCRCGANFGDLIDDIQEREGRMRSKVTHPRPYDSEVQAQQHLRNEATHQEDSPWRSEVTSGNANDV